MLSGEADEGDGSGAAEDGGEGKGIVGIGGIEAVEESFLRRKRKELFEDGSFFCVEDQDLFDEVGPPVGDSAAEEDVS